MRSRDDAIRSRDQSLQTTEIRISELELLVRERDVTVEELRQNLIHSKEEIAEREAAMRRVKEEHSMAMEEIKASHQTALQEVSSTAFHLFFHVSEWSFIFESLTLYDDYFCSFYRASFSYPNLKCLILTLSLCSHIFRPDKPSNRR